MHDIFYCIKEYRKIIILLNFLNTLEYLVSFKNNKIYQIYYFYFFEWSVIMLVIVQYRENILDFSKII